MGSPPSPGLCTAVCEDEGGPASSLAGSCSIISFPSAPRGSGYSEGSGLFSSAFSDLYDPQMNLKRVSRDDHRENKRFASCETARRMGRRRRYHSYRNYVSQQESQGSFNSSLEVAGSPGVMGLRDQLAITSS